jgi:hypothetical protein
MKENVMKRIFKEFYIDIITNTIYNIEVEVVEIIVEVFFQMSVGYPFF